LKCPSFQKTQPGSFLIRKGKGFGSRGAVTTAALVITISLLLTEFYYSANSRPSNLVHWTDGEVGGGARGSSLAETTPSSAVHEKKKSADATDHSSMTKRENNTTIAKEEGKYSRPFDDNKGGESNGGDASLLLTLPTIQQFPSLATNNETATRTPDIPYFWHVPKSGGTTMKFVLTAWCVHNKLNTMC